MTKTIFDVLRDDHQTMRDLLDRIEATQGDSEERRKLFGELSTEVRAHAHVEERVFYSTLLADERTRDKSGHSIEEHNDAEEILEELEDKDMSSSGWLARFKTLADDLRHHADEEEEELFPKAGEVLSSSQQRDMAARFQTEKQKEKRGEAA